MTYAGFMMDYKVNGFDFSGDHEVVDSVRTTPPLPKPDGILTGAVPLT